MINSENNNEYRDKVFGIDFAPSMVGADGPNSIEGSRSKSKHGFVV